MDNNQLKEQILLLVPEIEFRDNKQFLEIIIPHEKFHFLAKHLKEDENLSFDYLDNLTGVDWKTHLEVVYHLASTKHKHTIVLKTKTTDRENPELDSVCDLWHSAEFNEREVYDLFGIKFRNHPDLRRILLTDDWNGFPLRKDYADTHIAER
ncbi:MAG: NADH-quinone oxidoreductase subunit C [Bacteroidota bacterium]